MRPNREGRCPFLRLELMPVKQAGKRVTGFRIALLDITLQKEYERESRLLTEELERRVEQRTLEVREKAAALEALTRELVSMELRERHLIATDLHDYLGQLLVVAGMKAQEIGRHAIAPEVQGLVEEQRESLQQARQYVRTLIAELSPEILFHEGLVAAFRQLGKHMARHGLNVHVEGEAPAALTTEASTMLYQSVRELLYNTLKHAQTAEAWVKLGSDGDEVLAEVWDHGAGFDQDVQKQDEPGKFGLQSLRRRVEASGGSMDLRSVPGEGTFTRLRYPLAKLRPLAPAPHAGDPSETAPEPAATEVEIANLIIVDDHQGVRQGLRMQLDRRLSVQVVGEASDGLEGVELVERLQPDAVLMDINMPRMNGVEATRRIVEQHPGVTVVGLSMRDDPRARDEFLHAGAAAFFTKDSPIEEICNAIRHARNAQ